VVNIDAIYIERETYSVSIRVVHGGFDVILVNADVIYIDLDGIYVAT
jgi:hypothetical protein